MQLLSNLDYHVFQWINQMAESRPFWNPLMRFLAEDGEYLFYLGILIYWLTGKAANRRMVVQALVSACLAFSAGSVLSVLFYRDRPFVHHAVVQLIQHPANASFPSDHATGAFVIASSIALFRPKEGFGWLLFGACIAISRVWTGVHYPTDVLAGALLGTVSALAVHSLLKRSVRMERGLGLLLGIYGSMEKKLLMRPSGSK